MEPDAVGLRCDSASCNQFDFLPIKCHCSKVFCRNHISPDKHSCALLDSPAADSDEGQSSVPSVKRQRCALGDCQKLSLQSATSTTTSSSDAGAEASLPSTSAACPRCSLSFCVIHRHPDSHSCTGLQEQERELDTTKKHAKDILAQHFSNPSSSTSHTPVAVRRTTKPPTDPKKLAQIQKIALMKMRHSAAAGDPKDKSSSIPIEERLHVKARAEIPGVPMREHVLWFRKTVVTGKALDLISADLGVSYQQKPLCLMDASISDPPSRSPLQNDLLLSELVQDASTIILLPLPSSLDK